jgi:putative methyltransferase (TIGR04325 family)
MASIKKIIYDLVPPVVPKLISLIKSNTNRFKGDYLNWKEVLRVTDGYGDASILTAVQKSTRKVVRGEAKYERDQILFNDNVKRWPLIGALLLQSLKMSSNKVLSVMDFGGSLGSTYYQIRDVIEDVVQLRWSVIDQANFVAAGKAEFETEVLRFRESISKCLVQDQPTVALLSCVLNYVENPYEILEEILATGLPMVILDRTLLIEGSNDRLAAQLVSDNLGGGSYPIWFLSREKLEKFLCKDYTILSMFEGLDGTLSLVFPFDTAHSRGYVLVKK